MAYTAAVITISDKGYRGEREDTSGPNLVKILTEKGFDVTYTAIVPDEADPTVIRFRTKGDANDAADGSLVHYKNVIGTPIFSIPYLGYVAEYIQHPPGMYIAISAGAILLLLVFIPDIFADDKDKEQDKKKKSSRRNKGAHVAAHEAAAVDAEDIRREVEAGHFDDAAADALRQELLRREAKRDMQEVPH